MDAEPSGKLGACEAQGCCRRTRRARRGRTVRLFRRASLAAIGVAIVLPHSAKATIARDITREPLVVKDLAAARAFWKRAPRCSSYAVEAQPMRENYAMTELGGCVQIWSSDAWRLFKLALHAASSEQRSLELQWSCHLAIHEYGHSLGRPDEETEPRSIMYANGGLDAPNTPGICQRMFPLPDS
jgi:hypothetical protein